MTIVLTLAFKGKIFSHMIINSASAINSFKELAENKNILPMSLTGYLIEEVLNQTHLIIDHPELKQIHERLYVDKENYLKFEFVQPLLDGKIAIIMNKIDIEEQHLNTFIDLPLAISKENLAPVVSGVHMIRKAAIFSQQIHKM